MLFIRQRSVATASLYCVLQTLTTLGCAGQDDGTRTLPQGGTQASGNGGTGAGTGGAGTGGSSGSGGSVSFKPDLDRNVEFTWKETQGVVSAKDCMPGKYVGTFMCDYMDGGGGGFAATVTGPVNLTLQKSMNGEFLEISDGNLEGVANGIFGFTAKLAGKLDCSTLEFSAAAVDGVYGFGDPKLFPFGMFDGSLTGKLGTGMTLELSGDWSLTVSGGGSCVGPWKATLSP